MKTSAVRHSRVTQSRDGKARSPVDAYLAAQPRDVRRALTLVRRAIQAAEPAAIESVSYGLPAFRLNDRPLVAFRAAKTHCAIYPMSPDVIRALADELSAYDVSKGTIRFPIDAPLAATLVRRIVKLRAAELMPTTTRRSTGGARRRAPRSARSGSRRGS
jgi:uncharacterized protein YdhG (YjbR/CyaY superfamily)